MASELPTPAHQLEIYRRMFLIRRFEETVAELIGTGEMVGGAHLSIGQEAEVVGACAALRSDDYMVGTHRSHGHPLAKGADPKPLMAELLGRRTGIDKGKGGSMHLADFKIGSLGETSVVGAGLPLAVGSGLSAQLQGSGRVTLAFFGDGANNEGTFHESLNLAAIWRLPVVFFCENNLYAISTPFAYATAVPNVADRAAAYGIPGAIVDGQDPIACWQVVNQAVLRARAGEGPSLIEAKTYRFVEHSEGMRLSYRSDAEIAAWRERDPIPLYRAALTGSAVSTAAELDRLEHSVDSELEACVEFARASPFPEPADLARDVFAE